MTPTLRYPYHGPPRSVAPIIGTRPTPPPGPLCDTCYRRTSRYNKTGRCSQCCYRVGWPAGTAELYDTLEHPKRIHGHADDCACFTRRRPVLGPDGVQERKQDGRGRSNGSRKWVIAVTCPDCAGVRDISYGGKHPRLCLVGYMLRCKRCAERAKFNVGPIEREVVA